MLCIYIYTSYYVMYIYISYILTVCTYVLYVISSYILYTILSLPNSIPSENPITGDGFSSQPGGDGSRSFTHVVGYVGHLCT